MRDSKLYIATKVCWEHNVFLVVKPVALNRYGLAISRNGKEKPGEQVYGEKTIIKSVEKLENGRKITVSIKYPSIHEKIVEMYLDLYQKNFAGKLPAPIVPEPEIEYEQNYYTSQL